MSSNSVILVFLMVLHPCVACVMVCCSHVQLCWTSVLYLRCAFALLAFCLSYVCVRYHHLAMRVLHRLYLCSTHVYVFYLCSHYDAHHLFVSVF